MAYTYVLTSTTDSVWRIAHVRLLIPDNKGEDKAVFEDEEITAFLDLEAGNVWMAAAQALDSLANDNALVYKHLEVMDTVIDAVSMAKELRYRSATLRAQGAAKLPWDSTGMDTATGAT